MKDIEQRTLEVAEYIQVNKSTIRKTEKAFGLAKSTVHFDLLHRLPLIDLDLYHRVRQILDCNFEEKNIRGGNATKLLYKNRKNGMCR